MNVQKQIEELTTQRAVEWFETLQSGRTQEYPTFVRWISESPRHLSEFLAVLAMSQELPQAFARAGIDRQALLRRISPNVRQWPIADNIAVARKRPAVRAWTIAVAATIAAIVVSVLLWALL